MTPHADILEQPERLRGPFVGSLVLHISVAAVFGGYGLIRTSSHVQWGDPTGGGIGSVAINAVRSIPLPSRSGAQNPVANDTESRVPEPLPKKKATPKTKAPEPDAIPIKSRNAPKESRAPASAPNKWRAQQKELPNQVYSSAGQALTSPMYNLPGGGGVGIGNNSPFGTQFGYYATILRDRVAQNWRTGDIAANIQTAPPVAIGFTLRRDGSVAPGSVRVLESSGNRAIDFSAQRAVLDAAPFPALPAQYGKDQAEIELRFQLRR
jgi:periplasmic protein TonB